MKKQKDLEGNYHDDCDSDDWELHGCGPKCTLDGFCERHDGVHPKPKHADASSAMEGAARHTPTPWKVSRAGDNVYLYVDVPSEHWPVHNVIANIEDDYQNAKANAAYIVRAVNAHEALLNAVKEYRHNLAQETDRPDVSWLDEIIAKAESPTVVCRAEGK